MATRSKNRRRKKSKKRGALGLLVLELIGVAAFAALLTAAQGQRAAAVDASQIPDRPVQTNRVVAEKTVTGVRVGRSLLKSSVTYGKLDFSRA